MSAPFQPGDVVVCVDDRPIPHRRGFLTDADVAALGAFLKRGRSYRIESLSGLIGDTLTLVGQPAVFSPRFGGYSPRRFRKIDAEVTEDFREQMRKLPVRERVA